MMHTYGCGPLSVDPSSFQFVRRPPIEKERRACGIFVKALMIHNTVLQVLANIPAISFFSALARITTGTTMVIGGVALSLGKKEVKFGEELAMTGITQIFRGILELNPISVVFNNIFDISATVVMFKRLSEKQVVSDHLLHNYS